MFKKLLLVFTLALCLAAFAAPSSAQAQAAAFQPEMVEMFTKEAPLNQKDIDSYIKVMPEMVKIQGDAAKMADILKNAGWSESRFTYVVSKVSMGLALSTGASAKDLGMGDIPEALLPTKEEQELINKNSGAIQKAAMDAAAAQN